MVRISMAAMLRMAKAGGMFLRGGLPIGISRAHCVAGERVYRLSGRRLLTFPAIRHATGGSVPDLLSRLSNAQLNVTQSINNTGNVRRSTTPTIYVDHFIFIGQMFEKFSIRDVDSAGRGG